MLGILYILAVCCISTILLESLPILFLKNRYAWWKASLVCNLVTNPLLNTIMMLLCYWIEDLQLLGLFLFVLEAAVVLIEGFFYSRILDKRYLPCLGISLIANAMSFLAGFCVTLLLL